MAALWISGDCMASPLERRYVLAVLNLIILKIKPSGRLPDPLASPDSPT